MEEHQFDQYRVALFSEILGLITCRRYRFSHRTGTHIRWIGAGESPCEECMSKGLVDGQEESRTGVHVESEVLKCAGYNREGACDVLDVRMTVL